MGPIKTADSSSKTKEQELEAVGRRALTAVSIVLLLVTTLLALLPRYIAYWKRVNADADAYYMKVVRCAEKQ